mgnify:CR=1 FL=1|jgi:queuosine precursor transporter
MVKKNFKYLVPLSMFYTAVALADLVLVYRMSRIGSLTITAGIFVMPLYYLLEDIIAELYGYEQVRQVIWSVQIAAVIFSIIVTLGNSLPQPSGWHHAAAYNTVFGHVFRTILGGGLIAMLCGAFLNGYLLSKWKIYTRGRLFLLRSIGSSAIGQLVQTTLGCLLLYTGVLPLKTIFDMIIPLYCIQLSGCALISVPGAMLVAWLKKSEGGDVLDHHCNFNPFKFAVTQSDDLPSFESTHLI